jgi:histidinol-phosphatase (PHP family)
MGLPADYHMHTRLCRHAVGDATDLAAQAVKLGLSEIGFSEHNPMPRDDYDDWHPLQADFEEYIEQVTKARRDHPQLKIKIALEMDYIPGMEDWIRELTARHPWDYLIGAVHYVSETWDLDNPKKISEWKRHDAFEVWSDYFDRLTRAAESGFFNIIAHADLCKKFCFYPERDCTPLFTRLVQAIKKHGLAMELNTAGLRKDCKEIYPSAPIVGLAAQMGVPITFASDAHAPGEVAMNFTEAVQLARKFGYKQYSRFTQRKQESVPL